MIARTWTARATADGVIAYMDKVRADELPHFRSVPGYRGCRFMTRAAPGSGGGRGAGQAVHAGKKVGQGRGGLFAGRLVVSYSTPCSGFPDVGKRRTSRVSGAS